MIQWMLAIWSLGPLPFLNPAWTSGISWLVHILLKPCLENFEHYYTSMWEECSCAVVWAFFGLPFFVIGMKTDLFQFCGHCWVFQIYWNIEFSTFTAQSFRIWNSSTGIPSHSLVLFVVMLPKAHVTSHSRMSGSRWVITPSWLSESWRSFLYLELHYYNHWSYIELFIWSTASSLVIIFIGGSVIHLVIQEIIILWNKQNTNAIASNISGIKSKYFSHEPPPTNQFFFFFFLRWSRLRNGSLKAEIWCFMWFKHITLKDLSGMKI